MRDTDDLEAHVSASCNIVNGPMIAAAIGQCPCILGAVE